MKVDRLDTIIIIQERKITGTGSKEKTSWTDIGRAACKWNDLNSVELIKSDATRNNRYAQVYLRQFKGLNPTCRIIKDNEPWEVISFPKKDGTFFEIKVQRAVSG